MAATTLLRTTGATPGGDTMDPGRARVHRARLGSVYGDARTTRAAASGLDAVVWLMADAREQLFAEHDIVR